MDDATLSLTKSIQQLDSTLQIHIKLMQKQQQHGGGRTVSSTEKNDPTLAPDIEEGLTDRQDKVRL